MTSWNLLTEHGHVSHPTTESWWDMHPVLPSVARIEGNLGASKPEAVEPLDGLFLGHSRDLVLRQAYPVDQLP